MKTIICANNQRDQILRQLAAANGGKCEGVKAISLEVALGQESENEAVLALTLSQLLTSQADRYPIFRKMFVYPAFIQQIIRFVSECVMYDITADQLPADNANEAELAAICAAALDLDLAVKRNRANRDKAVAAIQQLPDAVIYPFFVNEVWQYELLTKLKEKVPVYQADPADPQVSLFYALNSRQEMEAVAQDICRRQMPCTVVLTSPTQQDLLQRVFAAYKIPCTLANAAVELHLPEIFYNLVQLGIHKDAESLLNAIRTESFPAPADSEMYAYLSETMQTPGLPEPVSAVIDEEHFGSDLMAFYQRAEEKAARYFAAIDKQLQAVLQAETPADILTAAFEVLRHSPYLASRDELYMGISIRSQVTACFKQIKTNDDLAFLAELIRKLGETAVYAVSDFCTVTDLTHPTAVSDNTYVLGVCGLNYPAIPVANGLFDENYLAKIKNYPSQKKRYDCYTSQLNWIEKSCRRNLIYSYYTNDYQGRRQQLAFDIEARWGRDFKRWPLAQLAPFKPADHSLPAETASQLFLKDGEIIGSVSTVERWFNCPYSYFLQAGLKAYEPVSTDLQADIIGTIQHAVMEQAVSLKGKEYPDFSPAQINEQIHPYFEMMKKMHPLQAEIMDVSEKRMTAGLINALAFMAAYEQHNSFVPEKTEERFDELIAEGVRLHGIIDRYDVSRDAMFRIIDYKSSSHRLNEKSFRQGLNLQLLSYLVIAHKMWPLTPAGAYYYSLKQEEIKQPAGKFTNKGGIIETDWTAGQVRQRMIDNKKLYGWSFTELNPSLDDVGKFISPKSNIYDYEAVEESLTLIYGYFRQQLLSGSIALSPLANACTFCKYSGVCRYHGLPRRPLDVVGDSIQLKIGKEDSGR